MTNLNTLKRSRKQQTPQLPSKSLDQQLLLEVTCETISGWIYVTRKYTHKFAGYSVISAELDKLEVENSHHLSRADLEGALRLGERVRAYSQILLQHGANLEGKSKSAQRL